MADSSQLEISGLGENDRDRSTTGPVPEALVDDMQAAAAELEAHGERR